MGHRGAVFGMRVESQIWAVRVDRYKWRKAEFRCIARECPASFQRKDAKSGRERSER